MKKKDLLMLLSPSFFFLIISVAGLVAGYRVVANAGREEVAIESEKKFERFVDNVKNGTWQLTTDKWIEGMRRTRAVAEAQRQVTASLSEIVSDIGWVALAGLAFQFAVVLSFRAKQGRQPALIVS